MLGLIKKDLLMIRNNLKLMVVLFFVYSVMAFQGEIDLSFILLFMSVMIMISTFSYDTYNKWNAYVCALPDGRKNSVRAKYLSTIVLIVMTTIITFILTIIIAYIHTKSIDFENILSTILGTVFATILLQSFMYPAIYKFGVEKARIGICIIVFGIAIIGGIIAEFIDLESFIKVFSFLNDYWIVALLIMMILMIYISYKISERIYKNKEY